MLCDFRQVGDVMECQREGCRKQMRIDPRWTSPKRYIARCKESPGYVSPLPADRLRLGSAIKAKLDAIGITQDRVASLVESIGLPPSCGGCKKRQEALDEFDRKVEAWLKKAAAWIKGSRPS